MAFIKSGSSGADGLRDLIKSADAYAKLTGTDLPEATKFYASALESPTQALVTLNKGIGSVDDSLVSQVQPLEAAVKRRRRQPRM